MVVKLFFGNDLVSKMIAKDWIKCLLNESDQTTVPILWFVRKKNCVNSR